MEYFTVKNPKIKSVLQAIFVLVVMLVGFYVLPVFVSGKFEWWVELSLVGALLLLASLFWALGLFSNTAGIDENPQDGQQKTDQTTLQLVQGTEDADKRIGPKLWVLRVFLIVVCGPGSAILYIASASGGFNFWLFTGGLLSTALFFYALFYFFLSPKQ